MTHPSVPEHRCSDLQTKVASALGTHLQHWEVGTEFQVEPSSDLCFLLELYLPQLLADRYPQWRDETLDGLFVVLARKTAVDGAELAGMCILMADQTVTPFSLRFALDHSHTQITAQEVRLGEPGRGRLGISGPPCHSDRAQILQYTIRTRLPDIKWRYVLTRDANESQG